MKGKRKKKMKARALLKTGKNTTIRPVEGWVLSRLPISCDATHTVPYHARENGKRQMYIEHNSTLTPSPSSPTDILPQNPILSFLDEIFKSPPPHLGPHTPQ